MPEVTIDLLGAAMRGRGCPVCSIVRGLTFDELCRLQRRAVVDPGTHAEVVAGGGYCAEHFWGLERVASPVTMAALSMPLMERLAARIGALAAEMASGGDVLRRDAAEIADRLGAPRACRVCDRAVLWEESAIASLLAAADDSTGWDAYRRSDGLCLPHLAMTLSTCGDTRVAEQLLHAADEQARRLASELTTYLRKREALDRSSGPEEAAPPVAIEMLVGGWRRRR